jgi:hypothetical protein
METSSCCPSTGRVSESGACLSPRLLARVELTTEADRYRSLNTSFLVREGEIDEDSEEWWLDVFVCERARSGPAVAGRRAPGALPAGTLGVGGVGAEHPKLAGEPRDLGERLGDDLVQRMSGEDGVEAVPPGRARDRP